MTCVAFHPCYSFSYECNNSNDKDEDYERFSASSSSVFIAAENRVLEYRINSAADSVFNSSTSDDPAVLCCSEDEINQLSLQTLILQNDAISTTTTSNSDSSHSKSNTNKNDGVMIQVAACDDNGKVRIVTLEQQQQQQRQQTTTTSSTCSSNSKKKNATTKHRTIAHDSQSLVTTTAFRPHMTTNVKGKVKGNKKKIKNKRNKQNKKSKSSDEMSKKKLQQNHNLVSGGTDCCIKYWDVRRPDKMLDCISMNDATNNNNNHNQICNPPMVHSLSWSPSGKVLAAGLGDGSVAVLKVEHNRKLTLVSRADEFNTGNKGHSHAVACVCFVNPDVARALLLNTSISSDNDNAGSDDVSLACSCALDRLLITAGGDGMICIWDLGMSSCDTNNNSKDGNNIAAIPPDELLDLDAMCCETDIGINEAMAGMGVVQDNRTGSSSICSANRRVLPTVLHRICHGEKPNSIAMGVSTMERCESSSPSTPLTVLDLYVADVSNHISMYRLPCRISAVDK